MEVVEQNEEAEENESENRKWKKIKEKYKMRIGAHNVLALLQGEKWENSTRK